MTENPGHFFTPDEAREALEDILKAGIIGEYDRGFEMGTSLMISGIESSIEKAKTMPEASILIPGLESALYVAQGLKEGVLEIHKTQNVTKTETNGENKNG